VVELSESNVVVQQNECGKVMEMTFGFEAKEEKMRLMNVL
jgi:hypothetical protein